MPASSMEGRDGPANSGFLAVRLEAVVFKERVSLWAGTVLD